MIAGVVKESFPGERRVSLVPAVIPVLKKSGIDVIVETKAGEAAGFIDEEYTEKGAKVLDNRSSIFSGADIILQVLGLGANPEEGEKDLDSMRPGQVVAGFQRGFFSPESVRKLAEREVTAFALELLPRITRAQNMDVLTSMATVTGYKSVLLAAETLPKMFPMLMTAAGTITPARVFVIGAGVAGLQAIATAKRLGAVVKAYDVRPRVKEEVESLGARFVELPLNVSDSEDSGGYAKAMDEEFYKQQREVLTEVVSESDAVITTAAVMGKKSPILITGEMVKKMMPGSVIVDIAAEMGGNCELTQPGRTIIENNVTIIGAVNLASTVPFHASQMFAKNVTNFLLHIIKDGELTLDMEDEITKNTLVTYQGEVVHPHIRELLGLS